MTYLVQSRIAENYAMLDRVAQCATQDADLSVDCTKRGRRQFAAPFDELANWDGSCRVGARVARRRPVITDDELDEAVIASDREPLILAQVQLMTADS